MLTYLTETPSSDSLEFYLGLLDAGNKVVNSIDVNNLLGEVFVVLGDEGDCPGGGGFYCWIKIFKAEDQVF